MTEQRKPQLLKIEPTQLNLKRAVEVICGKWRLVIIQLLRNETLRYGELKRLAPEISEKVLVHELKQLVELEMVDKKSYGEIPPRVEYSLTEKGRTVLPVIDLLKEVGQAFL